MKMPCLLVMYRHQIQTGVSLKEYLLAQVTKKHTVSLSLGLAGSRFSDVYIRKDSLFLLPTPLFLLPAISLSLSPPPPPISFSDWAFSIVSIFLKSQLWFC